MDVRGKKVYVGLSGGVDSAVSAARLKAQGALVTGVFIKGWYPPGMPCTWAADRRDAMRVAAHLQIPFKMLDASHEYKTGVIDYLVREYRAGRTPNPDVMCNREVKFGAFYRMAMREGAAYVATGHYLQGEKDQRYFLALVPHEVWPHLLFPVGTDRKQSVRAEARQRGLPVAEKKDSQGVCFLGAVSVEDFLESAFGVSVGEARTEAGERVGLHTGVLLHTLGERLHLEEQTAPGPWYVVAKDVPNNVLVVAPQARRQASAAREIASIEQNWLGVAERVACAQVRYRGARIPGSMHDGVFVPAGPADDPVVPGQLIAWYDAHDVLLGGGIIG